MIVAWCYDFAYDIRYKPVAVLLEQYNDTHFKLFNIEGWRINIYFWPKRSIADLKSSPECLKCKYGLRASIGKCRKDLRYADYNT